MKEVNQEYKNIEIYNYVNDDGRLKTIIFEKEEEDKYSFVLFLREFVRPIFCGRGYVTEEKKQEWINRYKAEKQEE